MEMESKVLISQALKVFTKFKEFSNIAQEILNKFLSLIIFKYLDLISEFLI